MFEFEGFWELCSPMILIAIGCLIPTIIGIIGLVVSHIITEKRYSKSCYYDDIEDNLRNKLACLKDEKEIEKASKELEEASKLVVKADKAYRNFEPSEWWQSLAYGKMDGYNFLAVCLGSIIGWVSKIVAVIALIITIPYFSSMKKEYKVSLSNYNQLSTIVSYYETKKCPTREFCLEAEKANSRIQNDRYYTRETKEKYLIDTTLVWAHFAKDIDSKKLIEFASIADYSKGI